MEKVLRFLVLEVSGENVSFPLTKFDAYFSAQIASFF